MVQLGGSDWTTIYVRNATNGNDLSKDVLKWVKFSGVSWTNDGLGFFYSRFDKPESDIGDMKNAGKNNKKLQFQKLYYHRIGTPQSDDILMHENKNQPNWMFEAEVSHDGKYVLIYTSRDTARVSLL